MNGEKKIPLEILIEVFISWGHFLQTSSVTTHRKRNYVFANQQTKKPHRKEMTELLGISLPVLQKPKFNAFALTPPPIFFFFFF